MAFAVEAAGSIDWPEPRTKDKCGGSEARAGRQKRQDVGPNERDPICLEDWIIMSPFVNGTAGRAVLGG